MTIEVNKYNEGQSLSGICATVVSDHTEQVSAFCDNSLLFLQCLTMGYVWNHCEQAADMVRIEPVSCHYRMDLGFAIHVAALLHHEAIQYYFYFSTATFQFPEFDAENWF